MEKLYRLGVQVSSTLDINVVLDLCINTTVEVLEAKMGFLFLMDEKNNQLFLGSMAISEDEISNSSTKSLIKIVKRGKLRLEKEKGIATIFSLIHRTDSPLSMTIPKGSLCS